MNIFPGFKVSSPTPAAAISAAAQPKPLAAADVEDPAIKKETTKAKEDLRRSLLKRKGRRSSILTSAQGVAGGGLGSISRTGATGDTLG